MERQAADFGPQIPFDANDKELRHDPKLLSSKLTTEARWLRSDARGPLLSSEILCVTLSERRPLFRQVVQREDGRHRAHGHASSAVDALYGIDIQHLFFSMRRRILFRMDTVHRASVHAGGVFGSDAWFCDHVCHGSGLPSEPSCTEPIILPRMRAAGTDIGCEFRVVNVDGLGLDGGRASSPVSRRRSGTPVLLLLLRPNLLFLLNSAKIMVCLSLPEATRKGT